MRWPELLITLKAVENLHPWNLDVPIARGKLLTYKLGLPLLSAKQEKLRSKFWFLMEEIKRSSPSALTFTWLHAGEICFTTTESTHLQSTFFLSVLSIAFLIGLLNGRCSTALALWLRVPIDTCAKVNNYLPNIVKGEGRDHQWTEKRFVNIQQGNNGSWILNISKLD